MKGDREASLRALEDWILCELRDTGLADDSVGLHLVDTWTSRTATLHRFMWERMPSPGVVVKVHNDQNQAAAHFHSMKQVADVLSEPMTVDLSVLRPLGLAHDLGAVLMPYVEGRHLSDLLESGSWGSAEFQQLMRQHVHACGASLARYHCRTQPEPTETTWRMAWDRLELMVFRALGSSIDLAEVDVHDCVTLSYGDFHPGHVLVTAEDRLVLLDPPIAPRYEFIYRDIARFCDVLFMHLIHPRGLWRHPRRVGLIGALRQAFLDGYASESGRPFTADDAFLMWGCEAFLLGKRLDVSRGLRYRAGLAYRLLLIKRRVTQLRRAMTCHLSEATLGPPRAPGTRSPRRPARPGPAGPTASS